MFIIIGAILATSFFFTETEIGRELAKKYQKIRNNKVQAAEIETKSEMCIKKGMTGNEVKQLQILLNRHGFNLTVDGAYGNGTEKAVKTIQGKNKLPQTGIVDQITYNLLQ